MITISPTLSRIINNKPRRIRYSSPSLSLLSLDFLYSSTTDHLSPNQRCSNKSPSRLQQSISMNSHKYIIILARFLSNIKTKTISFRSLSSSICIPYFKLLPSQAPFSYVSSLLPFMAQSEGTF